MPPEADTPTATKGADKVRDVQALHPRFFSNAEYIRTVYTATIPAGIEPDDLVKPEFWAHIASKLRPWDRIEAIAENGSYFAELLVLSASVTDAQVVILNKRKLEIVQKGESELLRDYEVSHTPATNWRVVRKTDRRTMQEGLPTRHDAVTWVSTHKRAA